MKRLFALIVFVLWAAPSNAQHVVMQQHCHSQACLFSSWNPNTAGDLLVAVIRVQQIGTLPCESTPQQCGMGGYFSVLDFAGNNWQRGYSTDQTSELWYAVDAKPTTNFVGVFASHGFDYPPQNVHGGGDFDYDVMIFEFPPAVELDSASRIQNTTDNNNSNPHAGPVTASTTDTLLIAWTDDLDVNNGFGPRTMTPIDPQFTVLMDDGFLAVAACIVHSPGTYNFSAIYNANALWYAGLVAFKIGTPEQDSEQPKFGPSKSRNGHITKDEIYLEQESSQPDRSSQPQTNDETPIDKLWNCPEPLLTGRTTRHHNAATALRN
jgi:hypothetical protein